MVEKLRTTPAAFWHDRAQKKGPEVKLEHLSNSLSEKFRPASHDPAKKTTL